jgi:DNA ligase (NAD+)
VIPPAKFDVRGEIVLPFPDLKNESGLNRNWRRPYSNPRNTASGSLKLQNSAEVKRPLECLCTFN